MTNKIIQITHTLTFCAAHKLRNPAWSDEKNAELFAPCHHDHGHNYTLMVTLSGPIDSDTGMLMNFKTLAQLMRLHVHDKLDHKHLNHDIPEFQTKIPTAENIAIIIWEWLSAVIPKELLYEVRIHETEKNQVIYRGEVI